LWHNNCDRDFAEGGVVKSISAQFKFRLDSMADSELVDVIIDVNTVDEKVHLLVKTEAEKLGGTVLTGDEEFGLISVDGLTKAAVFKLAQMTEVRAIVENQPLIRQ
jgi:hypothetical protein